MKLGSSAITLKVGEGALGPTRARLGHAGVLDVPDGLAILSFTVAGGTETLTHTIANTNGSAVTYAYYHKSGLALPIPATPLTSSDDGATRTVTFDEYDVVGAYQIIVNATNSTGPAEATFTTPAASRYPQAWPPGSFPDHAQSEVDDLNPLSTASVYSGGVRDASAWFYPIDLRCVAATAKGGTLVSPVHALFAAHYAPSVGATVTFYDSSLTSPISRTVTAVSIHPEYDSNTLRHDIAVATLSAPVDLPVAKTLPANWRDYVPPVNTYLRLPLLAFETDAGGQIGSSPLLESVTANGFGLNYVDRDAGLRPSIVSGDSGQPLFLVVNGQAAFIGMFTGVFYGTFLPDEITAVNAMMDGYDLEAVDLSEFAGSAPGKPTVEGDSELLTPVDDQLLIYWYPPSYAGTSAITSYNIYVDGELVPNGSFTVSDVNDYGAYGTAVLSGSFNGNDIQVAAVNSVGEGILSDAVTTTV